MDRRESWKLATHLNVYQIALLMAGYDPGHLGTLRQSDWPREARDAAEPYLTAIINAVLEQKIAYTPVYPGDFDDSAIDWFLSRVEIGGFREWLISRNYRDSFFIGADAEVDPLLDEASEFYAPKLAAAVQAWREVTADPDALRGRSPKQAIEIWLRHHANKYGLLDERGNPIKQAVSDISKVANWKPEGGATPTPIPRAKSDGPAKGKPSEGASHPTPLIKAPPRVQQNLPTPASVPDLDAEIPF